MGFNSKFSGLEVEGLLNKIPKTDNIWHSGNFTPSNYLPLSGGSLTNTLTIDNSNVGLILHRSGQSTPYIRFGQDANNEWGELGVYNDGRLVFWSLVPSQGGYGQWNTVWHSGNDGSGSGLDADLLDGKHYSDIINGNVASATRLQAYQYNSGEYTLISGTRTDNTFPRKIYDDGWGLCVYHQYSDGRVMNNYIATISDNVASATQLQNTRTIWGQSFNGTDDINGDLEANGDIHTSGGISQDSDINLKNKVKDVILSIDDIAKAPLFEFTYKNDENKRVHVGTSAQYWVEKNNWFCKKQDNGYYDMEIQNLALASAISIAKEFKKYKEETESTISSMKKEIEVLKQIVLNMNK